MTKTEAMVTISLEEFLELRDKAVTLDKMAIEGFIKGTNYAHEPVLYPSRVAMDFFESVARQLWPEATSISASSYAVLVDIRVPKEENPLEAEPTMLEEDEDA